MPILLRANPDRDLSEEFSTIAEGFLAVGTEARLRGRTEHSDQEWARASASGSSAADAEGAYDDDGLIVQDAGDHRQRWLPRAHLTDYLEALLVDDSPRRLQLTESMEEPEPAPTDLAARRRREREGWAQASSASPAAGRLPGPGPGSTSRPRAPSPAAVAEPATVAAPAIAERGPAPEPTMAELWQLLGRADVIMRALIEAPDRTARQRGQERARLWLRDAGQAWVHAPAPPPAQGGGRS